MHIDNTKIFAQRILELPAKFIIMLIGNAHNIGTLFPQPHAKIVEIGREMWRKKDNVHTVLESLINVRCINTRAAFSKTTN